MNSQNGGDARTMGGATSPGLPFGNAATLGGAPPAIGGGALLSGGRYEILQILGQGAMGAVYKARDREVDRLVAIKVIQPELANSPEMLQRFKQELILAREVTHRNVVRIFDIGEADGTKFITMEYIEGRDLKSTIVTRGKIPTEEAVSIIRQICQALDAAHSVGVVHRDLKPQNIMIDNSGRVVVMDFGIAHSKELPSMTMTGALVGTPEYMSPEQALGEKTDERADIFAAGIIFYEMLIGKVPFGAKTVLESMYKRTREKAVPPLQLDMTIPVQANQIVMKCLETDPANRYQTAKQILADLEHINLEKRATVVDRVRTGGVRAVPWKMIVAAVLLLSIAATLFIFRDRLRGRSGAPTPKTVLVADFSNHTGDALFDGTLEPVVKIALEGAGFITAYDRTQMRNLGLPPVAGKLDETAARQIAVAQGLGVVLSGSLDKQGNGYTLSLKATQSVTGNVIQTAGESASGKDQVLFATTKLAGAIRTALGDDTSESAQRFAMETLTATSLEAVHEYATAMEALANGKQEDALKSFSKAVEVDNDFGLSYAGMAIASRNLGRQQDAENYIKLALGHMDRMTERERYRTWGSYYLTLGDQQKCVEQYTSLIGHFPSDAAAYNNLALCSSQLRNFSKAVEQARQAAAILPKRVVYRNNASLYASYGSDFQTGEREARAAEALDPSFDTRFIALAFAELGQGQPAQATETYQKLEKISKTAASRAAMGLADVALYEGRFKDAVQILEQGASADLAAKSNDRAATKLAVLGFVRLLQGQKDQAVAAAESALSGSKIVKIRYLSGRLFAESGQPARAKEMAQELAAESQTEPQAYAKLIESELALAAGDAAGAVGIAKQANTLLDTWIGHLDLGRAQLSAGAFKDAEAEFALCLKRRGEALALFLDESPTYGFLPQVYYWQGKAREGMKSSNAADSFRTYSSIRGKAGEDPLISDAQSRAK